MSGLWPARNSPQGQGRLGSKQVEQETDRCHFKLRTLSGESKLVVWQNNELWKSCPGDSLPSARPQHLCKQHDQPRKKFSST